MLTDHNIHTIDLRSEDIVCSLIVQIAAFVYFVATRDANEDNWTVYYDEIVETFGCFGVNDEWLSTRHDDIVTELENHPGVAEVDNPGFGFSVSLFENYVGRPFDDVHGSRAV